MTSKAFFLRKLKVKNNRNDSFVFKAAACYGETVKLRLPMAKSEAA
jgi:hypothetical protein